MSLRSWVPAEVRSSWAWPAVSRALIEIPVMRWSAGLARRFGLRSVFVAGSLVYGFVFLAWSFLHSPLALALVATGDGVRLCPHLRGGRGDRRTPGAAAPALDGPDRDADRSAGGVGAIVGPSIGGVVFARLGAPALFGGAAALCVGGAVWVWFALAGRER